jgi:hypothetical protein
MWIMKLGCSREDRSGAVALNLWRGDRSRNKSWLYLQITEWSETKSRHDNERGSGLIGYQRSVGNNRDQ